MGICQFFNRLRQHQASPPVAEQFVTIDTTSTSATWTPTSIVNSGSTLEWEVTGGVTIAPQVIDKPIFNLSSNTGTANITIRSTTSFVGFTELWLNNGPASLEITSIDPSEATALTKIDLFTNDLTTIDLSSNTALIYPWIQSNSLTSIDLSNNTLATFIAIDNNSLTALDIFSNTILTDLWANDNLLTTSELDAIINDLDTNGQSNGEIRIAGNTGLPLTVASYQSYLDLEIKGWTIDVANSTPVDIIDPVIGTLAYANETDTTVELSMSVASTDNVAVVEHWIYKDFVFEKIITGATFSNHEITGLVADTNYDFSCVAYDAAGNFSLTSNVVNFTTDPTPVSNGLSPVLSYFRVEDAYDTRVYFDSSEIITASTGFNGYNGFTVMDKTINEITINSGSLVNHFFTVTVAFNHYSNNTIRYSGGSDISDSDSNTLYNFDLQYITNNIVEPSTTSEKFVEVGASGTGNTIGDPMVWSDAQSVAAGTKVYWEKGDYGAINFVQSTSGTLALPIIHEGYDATPGDSPSLIFTPTLAFDANVMPYINSGSSSGSGFSLNGKDYVIVKNIQVEGYASSIDFGGSSNYCILDNVYAMDSSVYSIDAFDEQLIECRVINSFAGKSLGHGIRIAGERPLLDNLYVSSTGTIDMDYYISLYGSRVGDGEGIIRNCEVVRDPVTTHEGHGISLRGNSPALLYNALVEDCTIDYVASAIELRTELVKDCVVRDVVVNNYQMGGVITSQAVRITGSVDCIIDSVTAIDCNMFVQFIGSTESPTEAPDSGNGNIFKNCVSYGTGGWEALQIVRNNQDGNPLKARTPQNNKFINCTFNDYERAIYYQAFLVTGQADVGNEFINCIITDTPLEEGGFNNETSNWSYTNNDLYNSFTAPSGTGNIDIDPQFVDLVDFVPQNEALRIGLLNDIYYDINDDQRFLPTTAGGVIIDGENASPVLLFKSGFETDVEVLALGTGGWPSGYQGIIGSDKGFEWGPQLIPSYGDGGAAPTPPYTVILSGLHVIPGNSTPQDILTNDLVTIVGHGGTLTTTLRQTTYIDPNAIYDGPTSQSPYQINNIVNIPDKTYVRLWVRYDDLVNLKDSGETKWRMLWQYKSGLYDGTGDANGYRCSISLTGLGEGTFYWTMVANKGNAAIPGNEFYAVSTAAEPDPTMGINVDGWNLVEVITGWATDDTGQQIFRLNGIEIFNRQNQRTLGPDDIYIAYLAFWSNYGTEENTSQQWFDNVEIWSDDPQIAFINANSVSILPATDTINVAGTSQLTATVLPSNTFNKYGKWTSDDEAVATVNEEGLVTGVATGAATITFTTDDGGYTDTSVITINAAYGPELITNGTPIGDTDWILGLGVTITGGKFVFTSVTHNIDGIRQGIISEVGKTFKVEFEIFDYVEGGIFVRRPGDESGTIATTEGVHTVNTISVAELFILRPSGTTTLKIGNVSCKEIL